MATPPLSMFAARAQADRLSAPAIAMTRGNQLMYHSMPSAAFVPPSASPAPTPAPAAAPAPLPSLATAPVAPVVTCGEDEKQRDGSGVVAPTNAVQPLETDPTSQKRVAARIHHIGDVMHVPVRPYYVGDSRNVLALQILDPRLLGVCQAMIRQLFQHTKERFPKVPHVAQDWKRIFASMFTQGRRTYYREATVPKTQSTIAQTAGLSESTCLLNPSFPPFVYMPLGVNQSIPRGHLIETGMPFTQPVSMMAEDVRTLYDGNRFYWWTYKSDGMRLMWISCTVGTQKISIWMDHKGRTWSLPGCRLPDRFYKGTVWDGELVRLKDGTRSFLVFDCLESCGRICGEYNHLYRLQIASSGIEEWDRLVPSSYVAQSATTTNQAKIPQMSQLKIPPGPPPFVQGAATMRDMAYSVCHQIQPWLSIRVKRMYATADIARLVRDVMPSVDHELDGLIGTPVEDPVMMNKCGTLFKIKVDHTIDFQLRLHLDVKERGCWFTLWTHDSNTNKDVMWTVHGMCWVSVEQAQRHGFSHPMFMKGRIVEFRLTNDEKHPPTNEPEPPESLAAATDGRRWVAHRVRGDKRYPNNLETVEKTWLNIKQSLRLTDIFPAERFSSELVHATLRNPTASRLVAKMMTTSAIKTGSPVGAGQQTSFVPALATATTVASDKCKEPPSWRVLKLRELGGNQWHERNAAAEAIVLPQPKFYGPFSNTRLRKAYKNKCSPWSYEGFVHGLLNK